MILLFALTSIDNSQQIYIRLRVLFSVQLNAKTDMIEIEKNFKWNEILFSWELCFIIFNASVL